MAIFLLLIFLTGCGNENPNSQEKIQKVGMLTRSNIDEKQIDDYTKNFNSAHGVTTVQQTIYCNNLNSMQMGLTSGNIDAIRTYGLVANYMTGRNSEQIKYSQAVQLVDNFSFAMRENDTALKNEFDAADVGFGSIFSGI